MDRSQKLLEQLFDGLDEDTAAAGLPQADLDSAKRLKELFGNRGLDVPKVTPPRRDNQRIFAEKPRDWLARQALTGRLSGFLGCWAGLVLFAATSEWLATPAELLLLSPVAAWLVTAALGSLVQRHGPPSLLAAGVAAAVLTCLGALGTLCAVGPFSGGMTDELLLNVYLWPEHLGLGVLAGGMLGALAAIWGQRLVSNAPWVENQVPSRAANAAGAGTLLLCVGATIWGFAAGPTHADRMKSKEYSLRRVFEKAVLDDRLDVVNRILEYDGGAVEWDFFPKGLVQIAPSDSMLERLIEAGAPLNTMSSSGWTPLALAAKAGKLETVKALLERGADPNIVKNEAWAPLSSAAYHGSPDMVRLLLSHGARLDILTLGETPYQTAVMRTQNQETMALLRPPVDGSKKLEEAVLKGEAYVSETVRSQYVRTVTLELLKERKFGALEHLGRQLAAEPQPPLASPLTWFYSACDLQYAPSGMTRETFNALTEEWERTSPSSPMPAVFRARRTLTDALLASRRADQAQVKRLLPLVESHLANPKLKGGDAEYFACLLELRLLQGKKWATLEPLLQRGLKSQPLYSRLWMAALGALSEGYLDKDWPALEPHSDDRTYSLNELKWINYVTNVSWPGDRGLLKWSKKEALKGRRELKQRYPRSRTVMVLQLLACNTLGERALAVDAARILGENWETSHFRSRERYKTEALGATEESRLPMLVPLGPEARVSPTKQLPLSLIRLQVQDLVIHERFADLESLESYARPSATHHKDQLYGWQRYGEALYRGLDVPNHDLKATVSRWLQTYPQSQLANTIQSLLEKKS